MISSGNPLRWWIPRTSKCLSPENVHDVTYWWFLGWVISPVVSLNHHYITDCEKKPWCVIAGIIVTTQGPSNWQCLKQDQTPQGRRALAINIVVPGQIASSVEFGLGAETASQIQPSTHWMTRQCHNNSEPNQATIISNAMTRPKNMLLETFIPRYG